MDSSLRRGSLEMVAAMLISGTIGWFVLVSGQPVLEVVFWRCVFGTGTLLVICAAFGFQAGCDNPHRVAACHRQWRGHCRQLGVAVCLLLKGIDCHRHGGIQRPAVHAGGPGGAVSGREDHPCQGHLAQCGIPRHAGDRQRPWRGQASGEDYLQGIALALGAALLYAIAALIIKRLKGTPPHLIALIQVATGVVLLAPWVKLGGLPGEPSALASLVTLGMVHTGLMYVLLYSAIQRLPTALTGALSFIYPIAAILVDWVAFGHRLAPLQWLGWR